MVLHGTYMEAIKNKIYFKNRRQAGFMIYYISTCIIREEIKVLKQEGR